MNSIFHKCCCISTVQWVKHRDSANPDDVYASVMTAISLYLEGIKEYEIIDRYRVSIDTLTQSVLVTIWSCGVPMIKMIPVFNLDTSEDDFERAKAVL